MPGQALPRIMPTHILERKHASGVGINHPGLLITALPPCLSHPTPVPGCTYGSRALTKACLGITGSTLPSTHPSCLPSCWAGCSRPRLAGRAEPWGKLGKKVAVCAHET